MATDHKQQTHNEDRSNLHLSKHIKTTNPPMFCHHHLCSLSPSNTPSATTISTPSTCRHSSRKRVIHRLVNETMFDWWWNEVVGVVMHVAGNLPASTHHLFTIHQISQLDDAVQPHEHTPLHYNQHHIHLKPTTTSHHHQNLT